MPKQIKVRCYGPITVDPDYPSLWEDVYLSWTQKPGRKRMEIAPCLVSKTDLISDLLTHKNMQEDGAADFSEDIERLEKALSTIENGHYYIYDKDNPLTDMCTPKEYIDKKEAEKMIRLIMIEYGYDNVKLKWERPKMVIISA